jgi:hypothetical protein
MPQIHTPLANRNGVPLLGRAVPVVAVVLAVGVFALGAGRLVDGCSSDAFCDAGTWGAIALLVVLSFTIVLALVLGVLFARRGRPGLSRRGVGWAVAGSLAVALVVSTPVSAGWDDGCNAHGALLPLAAYPLAILTSPEHYPAAYVDIQTLMLCAERIEIPRHRR